MDERIRQIAEAVYASYRDGKPVIVKSKSKEIFHGEDTLRTIADLNLPLECAVIETDISQDEWNNSDLPEFCEAARQMFMSEKLRK